jgi:O-antigen ligase
LLGTLLSRGLAWLTGFADRAGRLALYGGLVLVALTDLRLPSNVGGVADAFLGLSLLCACFVAARARRFHIEALQVHLIGAFLFVVGIAISTTQTHQDTPQNLLNLGKFVFTTTLLFFTCAVLIKRRRQVGVALGCWVVSAVLTSAVAILQILVGATILGVEAPDSRMVGLTTNPNHLGAVAALAMVGALSLTMRASGGGRLLWLVALTFCLSGILLSASRTGAVTALGALCVWLILHFSMKKGPTIIIAGLSLGAAAVIGYLFVAVGGGESLVDRLSKSTGPDADSAVEGRLFQYDLVLYESLKSPFVGVGLAEDDADVAGPIHNLFLRAFYGGGIFALIGIVLIVVDVVYKSWKLFVSTSTYDTKLVALGLLAGVIGIVLAGMTEPVLYQRQVWIPAALAMALWVVQQGRWRKRPVARISSGKSKARRGSVQETGHRHDPPLRARN